MKNYWVLNRLLFGISAVALAASAQAQQINAASEGEAAKAAPEGGALGEIIVTAQKRSEVSQRAPIAVTVVSGQDLTNRGINSAAQLTRIVPSAQFTVLRNSINVFMRGVGQSVNAPNADTAIATNVNGVFVPTEMTGAAFFDLERVEVLPGPQGTLYGRNAAGGVVNIISRRPKFEFGGDYSLEVGNYGLVNASGGVDIPLSDTLAIRPAGRLITRNGYTNGSAYDQETRAGRLTLRWEPSDADSLVAATTYNHEGGVGPQEVNNPPLDPNDPWRLPFDSKALGLYRDFNTWLNSLEYSHDFGNDISITYLAGYGRVKGRTFNAQTYGPRPATPNTLDYGLHVSNYSNELRLAGDGRLKWVVGLYQYGGKSQQDFVQTQHQAVGADRFNIGDFTQHARGYAAFGQLTYPLLPAFRLTAGGRYSHDWKDIDGFNTSVPPGTAIPFRGERSSNHADWKAGFEFDVGPRSLLYGGVGTGFNQGGLNTTVVAPGSTEAAPFKPQYLLAYTLGSKNRFLDNRLEINAEAYYYKYDNYQVSARNQLTAQNQVFNAQDVRIYGVDFSSRLLPFEGTQLSFKASYLHAEAKELILPVAPFSNFSGFELPYSPDWTIIAEAMQRVPLANGAHIEGAATYTWYAGQWGIYTHAAGTYMPKNDNIDLSLTYRTASERLSVAIWMRNAGDEFSFRKTGGGGVPGPGFGAPLPPRTYGITLSGKI